MLNDLLASETIEIECPSIGPERLHDKPEIEPEVEITLDIPGSDIESETPEVQSEAEPSDKIESSDDCAIESGDLKGASRLRYKC